MACVNAKHHGALALPRDDPHDPSHKLTVAGPTSVLHRRATRDLAGVDSAVTGVSFDQAFTNPPGVRFGRHTIRKARRLPAPIASSGWPLDSMQDLSSVESRDMAFDAANVSGSRSGMFVRALAVTDIKGCNGGAVSSPDGTSAGAEIAGTHFRSEMYCLLGWRMREHD